MNPLIVQSGYGGFRIGGMALGLPMHVLREVVPCGTLISLPCAASYIIGGIDLRGILVPVIDLRIVLGMAETTISFPNVLIVVYDHKIFGLLTETVTGVFTGDQQLTMRINYSAESQAIFCGSTRRSDDGTLVSLLSPEALAMLKDVPVVDDSDAKNLVIASNKCTAMQKNKEQPVLLMGCGKIAMAIDAMAVFTTLSDPVIQRSAIAMGDCRGIIEYANSKIPVIDLISLCGLGKLDLSAQIQVFVILLPQGAVAFLVNKIIDVIRVRSDDIIHVPAYALPRPSLFVGALPNASISVTSDQHASILASQYLVLNSATLMNDPQILSLADLTAKDQSIGSKYQTKTFMANRNKTDQHRLMITYLLDGEIASPFEQIREILPFSKNMPIFEQDGPMIGMIVVRGRSIPVVCLTRLITGQTAQITPHSSVLVVEIDNEAMGFAIPALKSIETAQWEPELPQHGKSELNNLKEAIQSGKLAQVSEGVAMRMLPILDLEKIANRFRAQQCMQSSTPSPATQVEEVS